MRSIADRKRRRPGTIRPIRALEERFKRVKAKLMATSRLTRRTLNRYPESDHSIYARYARAYAWHKAGYPDKADAETRA